MNDFTGHDPETGILTRLRHWSDVAPPILLTRVLRLAGSPTIMLSVWVVWTLTVLFDDAMSARSMGWPIASLAGIALLLVWTGLFLAMTRQGAMLVAGHEMESWSSIAHRIIQRSHIIAGIFFTLPLAIFAMGLPSAVLLRFAAALPTGDGFGWMQVLLAGVASVLLIPSMVLASAGIVALAMALSAVVNESDPDPLDSLSRGYEYAFRGYLPLVGLSIITAALTVAIFPLAEAVSTVANFSILMMQRVGGVAVAGDIARFIFNQLPVASMIVVAAGCTGGVYLLLRRFTGGQEVDDLWVPSSDQVVKLPTLDVSD